VSYGIIVSREAVEDLRGLTPPAQDLVNDELEKLAADPLSRGTRSHFPYRVGQMYQFAGRFDDRTHHFTVLFKFTVDERNLYVYAIAVSPPMEPW
jgi:mRNA-degrading endonuclease RelE of RelBE toxin-antitoxin system